MCSGADFDFNGIHVRQYGGYWEGKLELTGKISLSVKQGNSLINIKTALRQCTKNQLIEILAGIVKYTEEE